MNTVRIQNQELNGPDRMLRSLSIIEKKHVDILEGVICHLESKVVKFDELEGKTEKKK